MPKIVNREEYRKCLLSESFEIFAEIGYGNITMRQLAQRLGVSTGTLYHYFPSKEDIFLQLVTQITQQDISNFLTQAESIPEDIRSRVRAILEFVKVDLDYFSKQLFVSIDYYKHNALAGKKLEPVFEQLDREVMQAVADFLQIDDLAIAEFILIFINGLIWCQIYSPNAETWYRQTDLLVDLVDLKAKNVRA